MPFGLATKNEAIKRPRTRSHLTRGGRSCSWALYCSWRCLLGWLQIHTYVFVRVFVCVLVCVCVCVCMHVCVCVSCVGWSRKEIWRGLSFEIISQTSQTHTCTRACTFSLSFLLLALCRVMFEYQLNGGSNDECILVELQLIGAIIRSSILQRIKKEAPKFQTIFFLNRCVVNVCHPPRWLYTHVYIYIYIYICIYTYV